jgi:hypothetical protein
MTISPGRTLLALSWVVALLGSAAAVGLCFWLAPGDREQLLLPAVVLVLTALFGLAWLFHLRAVRRWNAALDSYAQREMDRAAVPAPNRPWVRAARTAVLQGRGEP